MQEGSTGSALTPQEGQEQQTFVPWLHQCCAGTGEKPSQPLWVSWPSILAHLHLQAFYWGWKAAWESMREGKWYKKLQTVPTSMIIFHFLQLYICSLYPSIMGSFIEENYHKARREESLQKLSAINTSAQRTCIGKEVPKTTGSSG